MSSLLLIVCMIAAQTGSDLWLRGQPLTELQPVSGSGYTLTAWTGPFGYSSIIAAPVDPEPYSQDVANNTKVIYQVTAGQIVIFLLIFIRGMVKVFKFSQ